MSEKSITVTPTFSIGDLVKHKHFSFRGVIFDIDPQFDSSEEWYQSIPAAIRPRKDQPFYHLLAEDSDAHYVAYVSQQNLIDDSQSGPVTHPDAKYFFSDFRDGRYILRARSIN